MSSRNEQEEILIIDDDDDDDDDAQMNSNAPVDVDAVDVDAVDVDTEVVDVDMVGDDDSLSPAAVTVTATAADTSIDVDAEVEVEIDAEIDAKDNTDAVDTDTDIINASPEHEHAVVETENAAAQQILEQQQLNHALEVEEQDPDPEQDLTLELEFITHTPMPKFEKKFRKEIIKPLSTLLESDGNQQNDILLHVRFRLYTILQGIFLEAKESLRLNVNANVNANVNGGGEGGDGNLDTSTSGIDSDVDVDNTNADMEMDINADIDGCQYIIPGMENIPIAECIFHDPAAEKACTGAEDIDDSRNSHHHTSSSGHQYNLLPIVYRMLLKLGGKGGKDFEYLTVPAEDLVACILLDFMTFVVQVLKLGVWSVKAVEEQEELEEMEMAKIRDGNGNGNGKNDHEITGEDEEKVVPVNGSGKKKRSRADMENNQNGTRTGARTPSFAHIHIHTPRPNAIRILGNELLKTVTLILSTDACLSGHVQSKRLLRSQLESDGGADVDKSAEESDWQNNNRQNFMSEEEVIGRLLPFFYVYNGEHDDMDMEHENDIGVDGEDIMEGEDANDNDEHNTSRGSGSSATTKEREDHMSPLRTGEWGQYHKLYYGRDVNVNASGSASASASGSNNGADGNGNGNTTFGRHYIAIVRLFVEEGGLENLNILVSTGLEGVEYNNDMDNNDIGNDADREISTSIAPAVLERIDVTSFKSILAIFSSIWYLSSFLFARSEIMELQQQTGTGTPMEENGNIDSDGGDAIDISNVHILVELFQPTLLYYLDSIEVGGNGGTSSSGGGASAKSSTRSSGNISKQSDVRVVLDILSMLENAKEADSYNTNSSTSISSPIDMYCWDFDKLKVSMLWRFLTGENTASNKYKQMQSSSSAASPSTVLPVPPSLQCQIFSLSELKSWLQVIENEIRDLEADYEMGMGMAKSFGPGFGPGDDAIEIIGEPPALHGPENFCHIAIEGTSFAAAMTNNRNSSNSDVVNLNIDDIDDDNSSTEACCNNSDAGVSVASSPSIVDLVGNNNGNETNYHHISHDQRERDVQSISSEKTLEPELSNNNNYGDGDDGIQIATVKRGDIAQRMIAESKSRLMHILDLVGGKIKNGNGKVSTPTPTNTTCSTTNFMKHLFTSGLHSELLKRILPLLQFLGRYNRIDKEGIQLLWDASGMRKDDDDGNGGDNDTANGGGGGRTQHHESVTSAVLNIMTGLINTKDCWVGTSNVSNSDHMPTFDYLSGLLEELGSKEDKSSASSTVWTSQTIAMLEAVVRRSIDLIVLGADNADLELMSIGNDKGDGGRSASKRPRQKPACFQLLWKIADGHFCHGNGKDGVKANAGGGSAEEEIAEKAFAYLLAAFETVLMECSNQQLQQPPLPPPLPAAGPGPQYGPQLPLPLQTLQATDHGINVCQGQAEQLRLHQLQTHLIHFTINGLIVDFDDVDMNNDKNKDKVEEFEGKSTCRTTYVRMLHFILSKLPSRGQPQSQSKSTPAVNGNGNTYRDSAKVIIYLEDLLDQFVLKDILTNEMIHYAIQSRNAFGHKCGNANGNANENVSVSVDDEILVGKAYSHSNCVSYREGLLQMFIFRCSQVILAKETIENTNAHNAHTNVQIQQKSVPSVMDGQADNDGIDRDAKKKRSISAIDLTSLEDEEDRHSKRHCIDTDMDMDTNTELNTDMHEIPHPKTAVPNKSSNESGNTNGFRSESSDINNNGNDHGHNHEHDLPSLLPTEIQIANLWSQYVAKGLSPKSQDGILGLFHYLLCSRDLGNISFGYDRWRKQLAIALYTLFFCSSSSSHSDMDMDILPSDISMAAYDLLIYCLGHVNAMEGYFKIVAFPGNVGGNNGGGDGGIDINIELEMEASSKSDFLLGLQQNHDQKRQPSYMLTSIFLPHHRYIAGICLPITNNSATDTPTTTASKYSTIRGLDLLWRILLENPNDEVAEMAMQYIATIYTYTPVTMSDADRHVLSKEQKAFVNGCFAILSHENGPKGSQQQQQHYFQVKRIICLLRLFTDSIYQSSSYNYFNCGHGHESGHGHSPDPNSLALSMALHMRNVSHGGASEIFSKHQIDDILSDDPNPLFAVQIQEVKGRERDKNRDRGHLRPRSRSLSRRRLSIECLYGRNTPINFIRCCIHSQWRADFDYGDFRLIFEGVELKDGRVQLGNLGIGNNSIIHCVPRLSTDHVGVSTSNNDRDKVVPIPVHVIDSPPSNANENDTRRSKSVESKSANNMDLEEDNRNSINNSASASNSNSDPNPTTPLEASEGAGLGAKDEIFANAGIQELVSHQRLEVLFSLLSNLSCDNGVDVDDKDIRDQKNQQLSAKVRTLAWTLLQELPTETELNLKLISACRQFDRDQGEQRHNNDVEWSDLMPYPSTHSQAFQLLYALQAFERRILSSDLVIEQEQEQEQIQESFKVIQEIEEVTIIDDDRHSHPRSQLPLPRAKKSKKENTTTNTSTGPIVVVDDDDSGDVDEKSNGHSEGTTSSSIPLQHINDNTHTNALEKNRKSCIQHLVSLLKSIDFERTLEFASSSSSCDQMDYVSILITSSNKIIHLLLHMLQQNIWSASEPESDANNQVLFGLPKLLLGLIHWSVSFQKKNSEGRKMSNDGKTNMMLALPGIHSLIDVSGALSAQCLFLLDKLTKSESHHRQFLSTFCSARNTSEDSEILRTAIISSIIDSPTRRTRTDALAIFRRLFLLEDRKNSFVEDAAAIQNNDDIVVDAMPNIFALFASLLPFDESAMKAVDTTTFPRYEVIFTLFVKSMTSLWSCTAEGPRKTITNNIEDKIGELSGPFLKREKMAEVRHVEDIGNILVCLIQDMAILLRCQDQVNALYLVGTMHIIQSILDLPGRSNVRFLIGKILIRGTTTMLELLLEKCTFDSGHQSRNSFSLPVRIEISSLLKLLCQDCKPNTAGVITFLLNQAQHNSPRPDLSKTWGFDPSMVARSVTGLIGLRNQGATCYMNSLLQQLFHIPAFRKGILYGLRESPNCELAAEDEGKVMLQEFQKLFGYLLLSGRRDYNTVNLVQSIRGYDGKPIRPGEQQDVDEFFNLFTDRLESALKGSSQHRLLQNVFGGQLSHLVTCKKCGFGSERVEDCLSISLDVKGKKDISESLTSYIQGDLLDGANQYFCSNCETKQDSVKRCCIKTLPNVLICHLKRFEFDLEMLRKVKVNDRFEFPAELDMHAYTKEGIDGSKHDETDWRKEDYYQYSLRGVLVHTGTADSGHYYSLCSVRNNQTKDDDNLSLCENGNWFCFNDSTVTPFNESTLDSASFGGHMENGLSQGRQSNRAKCFNGTKVFNAYLLIYDRVDMLEFDEQSESRCKKMDISTGINISEDPPWKTNIVSENDRFCSDIITFSPQYKKFITDICTLALDDSVNAKKRPNIKIIQMKTLYLFDVMIHSSCKNEEIEQEFSNLCKWYSDNTDACKWVVHLMNTTHQSWLQKMLFHCKPVGFRSHFVKMMNCLIRKLAPCERDDYCVYASDVPDYKPNESTDGIYHEHVSDSDDDMIRLQSHSSITLRMGRIEYWRSKSSLARLIGHLIDLIDECSLHWRNFSELFELIEIFSRFGHKESTFLIRCGLILKVVDFYQGVSSIVPQRSIVRSPLSKTKPGEDKRVMGDRSSKPNFFQVITLLCYLARSAHIPDDDDGDVSDSDSDESQSPDAKSNSPTVSVKSPFVTTDALSIGSTHFYQLPKRDARILSSKEIFTRMLIEKEAYTQKKQRKDGLKDTLSQFLSHLAFGNLDVSLRICSAAGKMIADKKADEAKLSADALMILLHVRDQYTENRVSHALISIMKGIEANVEFEKEIVMLLETLIVELSSRRSGNDGFEEEVISYNFLLKKVIEIFALLESNSAVKVKQKLFTFARVLLRHSLNPSELDYQTATELVSAAYRGKSLDCLYEINMESIRKKTNGKGTLIPYSTDTHKVEDTLFDILSSQYVMANEVILNQNGTKGYKAFPDVISSASFAEYFFSIRVCISGSHFDVDQLRDSKWILKFTSVMLKSFWKVDEGNRNGRRCEMDILKGEMMRLFGRFVQISPRQFYAALIEGSAYDTNRGGDKKQESVSHCGSMEDPIVKFLEIYVTAKEDSSVYNNTYTLHFYSILEVLADFSSTFQEELLRHDNFTWAISSFVLDQRLDKRGHLYHTLMRSAVKYLRLNVAFREKVFKKILHCSLPGSHSNSFDIGALELLIEIFRAEGNAESMNRLSDRCTDESHPSFCISSFLSSKTGGMSFLSIGVKSLFTNISSLLDVNCLSLYLTCMLQVLTPLRPAQVKKVMISSWPELDEINFILTQIMTRRSEEWNLDCESLITEVVNVARNLQSMLLSSKIAGVNKQ